jgi:hypothetical protein
MLIKRRLCTLQEIVKVYGVAICATLVRSAENKADALTRVRSQWLQQVREECCAMSLEEIRQIHNANHMGIRSTLYLARQLDGDAKEKEVSLVVKSCLKCQSTDPAPIKWQHGSLEVDGNWVRLACDVTHYGKNTFLTVVDCGPSRFAIWREIPSEDAQNVSKQLEQIFIERGPPSELLMDNGLAFRSKRVEDLCQKWNVKRTYRCAYRPEGNGLVERNHRSIKRLAARTGKNPAEMVYWYNAVPRSEETSAATPASLIYTYTWHPMRRLQSTATPPIEKECEAGDTRRGLKIGDPVFLKPPGANCTTKWPVGNITAVNSSTNLSVDGVPRHVSDMRPVPKPWEGDNNHASGTPETIEDPLEPAHEDPAEQTAEPHPGRRSSRERRRPRWLDDYDS